MKFECKKYPKLNVWDAEANKVAAQFINGVFETADEHLIGFLKQTPDVVAIEEQKPVEPTEQEPKDEKEPTKRTGAKRR